MKLGTQIHVILLIHYNNQTSKQLPFASIISAKRLVTEWYERLTTSSSKADHDAGKTFFRAATLD